MMSLMQFLESQPALIALVGATLTGGALFTLRQAPATVWAWLQHLLTVTLVIEPREEAFAFVTQWLSNRPAVNRARQIMIVEGYDYKEQRWRWRMTLGRGLHLLSYGGAWIFVYRDVKETGDIGSLIGAATTQRLFLISLGRSQVALRRLIDEAKAEYFGDGLVKIFIYDGGWLCVDRRPPRPLETVFLPAEQKRRIIDDLRAFTEARDLYRRRGAPWRRGYLLCGPPGTGKTTIIFAAAGALGRPIYAISLDSIKSDNELITAINSVVGDAIVVIEDIDAARMTRNREDLRAAEDKAAAAGLGGLAKPETQSGVTLSGLLNAIDGLAAREGRILFATTNHPERLDPALLRPGRFDLRQEIEPLGRRDAAAMIAAYGADPALLDDLTLPIAAAELQGMLLGGEAPAKRIERAA